MSEIKTRNAQDLQPEDARTLLLWRDNTHESLVHGLSLQVLLDLYHRSAEFGAMEYWLTEDPNARRHYRTITGRSATR